ncbi:glycosyl hydrolase 5 family protein-like [Neltuma alba]|uniref:glycosyl hydrolase 5 family protein-like n=1 Tax=Neltuma alba TaxID=207710 RepID=UPI0010A4E0A6|nr:glycosyl hydrolase 5 family protein-like [Prosopis alba]
MVGRTLRSALFFFVAFSALLTSQHSNAYPLSTQSRWITDDFNGERAKLVCGNWAGHLQPMLPEGLDKRPLKEMVAQIVKYKFNCVRLTYAIYMWTRYMDRNAGKTLEELDIPETVEGIKKNNPWVLNKTHVEAFEEVVRELGNQKVKVLLDNHVSDPKWCCADDDENGFFNDRHFDPNEWVKGLTWQPNAFLGIPPYVVAMSLRNELHGPRQYVGDWYIYMSQGATAVHRANPNVLVVVSGLNYDTELQFLKKRPLHLGLGRKLVFETHLYSWSGIGTLKLKDIWTKQPLNRICARAINGIDHRAGFLTRGDNAFPLIFTEFGFDQEGSTEADNKYLTCLQTYLVGRDLDWGLWALQGGYYLREDQVQLEETFGVMDASWQNLRFPNFTQLFQLLQRKNQDPTSKFPIANILYYPLSGQCVHVNQKNELEVGSCENKIERWVHEDGSQILLSGTNKCLTASGEGLPVVVSDGNNCQSKQSSSWKSASLSKLHLATVDQHGKQLCLHQDANSSTIVTRRCICILDDPTCLDDPRSQWFQFVPTNL